MFTRKANSSKNLEKNFKILEAENEQLRKSLLDNSNHYSIEYFFKYLQTENVDLLIVNTENLTTKLLFQGQNMNVLLLFPNSILDLKNLLPDEDQESFLQTIKRSESKGTLKFRSKLNVQRNDFKETKPIEFVFSPLQQGSILLAIKDITELTKQQKELSKTREKMEESDKLKTILLSNISHQIRTPLNSITGFSELLATEEPDIIKRKEYIEIIKRQSKRILNLIDNISEVSKLESGKINISKTVCNLDLMLNELLLGLNQQRTETRKEAVSLELLLPEKKSPEVLCDTGRLQQVLLNLVYYSLRYTQQGKIQFGYQIDEISQKLEFFLHDTSDGLTKEEQKTVFDRFMVIDKSEAGKLEDPGLGLTIAREIVKALGGRIWVESEKEKGTSFFFQIPFEVADETHHDGMPEELLLTKPFNFANKVILIVDDEDVNAMFLEAVFQETGAQTIFAKNGIQAVDLLKSINKIDLVLMDLKMPLMNGIAATKEIRKFNKTVPIIAQTALASEEDKNECLSAGCNNVILKPIEVLELMQMVSENLNI
ncbi:MAG: response regulator [Bacteroidota bacterium]|nr:MAG: response regulator [Bacteroidota bacterium]